MKRIFLVAASILLAVAIYAQDATAHMKFKGVPIDGSLTEFVSKMKKEGFVHIGSEDGLAMLKGEFVGSKDCVIGVYTSGLTNNVSTVVAAFPASDNWSALEGTYLTLKEMLTIKYGEPSESVEEFQAYSDVTDNALKLMYLQSDQCTYYTTFETSAGDIQLSLMHTMELGCFVKLQYWDKINTKAVMNEALDDL